MNRKKGRPFLKCLFALNLEKNEAIVKFSLRLLERIMMLG